MNRTTTLATCVLAAAAVFGSSMPAHAGTDYVYWNCYYDNGWTAVKASAWDNSNGTRTYHFYVREKNTAPSSSMQWLKMRSPSGYTWKQWDLRGVYNIKEWYYTKPNQNKSYVHVTWNIYRSGVLGKLTCPKTAGAIGKLM